MEEKKTARELLDMIELAEKTTEYWRTKQRKNTTECPNCIRNISISQQKTEQYYEQAINLILNS